VKQQTHTSYWLFSVIFLLLFVLVACVRPVPESEQPQATEMPAVPPTSEQMPIETPTPLPEEPAPYPEAVDPIPEGETNPNDDVAAAEPTAVPPGQPATHTVQAGETLSSISVQYGVSQEAIAAANNITTDSVLTVGQSIVIPASDAPSEAPPPEQSAPPPSTGEQVHVVQPGENLFRISLNYGKSVDEVAAYNGIANPHYIYPGQVIRIP